MCTSVYSYAFLTLGSYVARNDRMHAFSLCVTTRHIIIIMQETCARSNGSRWTIELHRSAVSLSIPASVYGVGKRAFLRTAFNYAGVFRDVDNCTRLRTNVKKKKNLKKKDWIAKIELHRFSAWEAQIASSLINNRAEILSYYREINVRAFSKGLLFIPTYRSS